MSWRMRVQHHTGYAYPTPARSSYNEARMTPVSGPTQSVWSSRLTVEPTPWSVSYTDYWAPR